MTNSSGVAADACASLMMNYEFEQIYSKCAYSSDFNQATDLPRKCSLGFFESTPVWKNCSRCQNLTLQLLSEEELWPRTAYTQLSIKRELQIADDERERLSKEAKDRQLASSNKDKKPGCAQCQNKKQPKKSKGLGDTIAKVTSFFGIKQCDACKKRRKFLNKKVKYGKNS
tara:strand:- start:2593 stop:3105 length:513 start_codon:yes stop_codon:yes gene_type:complete